MVRFRYAPRLTCRVCAKTKCKRYFCDDETTCLRCEKLLTQRPTAKANPDEYRTCPSEDGGCGLIKAVKDFSISWGRPTTLCRACIGSKIRANCNPRRPPPPTLIEVWEQATERRAKAIEEMRERSEEPERPAVVSGVVMTDEDVLELNRRRAKFRGVA